MRYSVGDNYPHATGQIRFTDLTKWLVLCCEISTPVTRWVPHCWVNTYPESVLCLSYHFFQQVKVSFHASHCSGLPHPRIVVPPVGCTVVRHLLRFATVHNTVVVRWAYPTVAPAKCVCLLQITQSPFVVMGWKRVACDNLLSEHVHTHLPHVYRRSWKFNQGAFHSYTYLLLYVLIMMLVFMWFIKRHPATVCQDDVVLEQAIRLVDHRRVWQAINLLLRQMWPVLTTHLVSQCNCHDCNHRSRCHSLTRDCAVDLHGPTMHTC